MRLSSLLVPLKKLSNPTSVDLLAAHGFVRKSQSGVYDILPLGLRVQRKIEAVVRKHMAAATSVELALSSLVDPELWKSSGRLIEGADNEFMFSGKNMLAPTGEEQITTAVGSQSYKSLPLSFYQITRKYRNELRPKSGLLRTREFTMKDAYTFDATKEAAIESYNKMTAAYQSIFKEIGVEAVRVAADSGDMGGSLSHEYHLVSDLGEDTILKCADCGSTRNIELGGSDCCGTPMQQQKGIEVAHTFYLGTRYTEPLNSNVTLSNNKVVPMEMGCYGIGTSRLVGAIADSLADSRGLVWPATVAPAQVCVVGLDTSNVLTTTSRLTGSGIEAVAEDRTTNLGQALRAAREAGWPQIVVLGKKFSDGLCDIETRQGGTKQVRIEELVEELAGELS